MCEYAGMFMMMMIYFCLQYRFIVKQTAFEKKNQTPYSLLIGRYSSSYRVCSAALAKQKKKSDGNVLLNMVLVRVQCC